MKFGIIFLSQPDKDVDQYPYQSIHERVTAEIVAADRAGYDYAWIAEHHASDSYGILPDPLTYIAYLANLTERIRLCSGVMVVPLHNTVRLVENVSFVDILTQGRFVFGIGSGYREYEFEALGSDFEARREIQAEALDVMMRLFNDHQIDHQGVHLPSFKITGDNALLPHSIQQPHPPMYMGAASESSIQLCARYGLGLLMSTLTPISELKPKAERYLELCEDTEAPYDQNPGHREIGIGRMVYVAETDEKAKAESAEAVVRHINSFTGASTSGYLGTISDEDKQSYSEATYDDFCEDTILHGSPETVIEKIHSMRESTHATSMILHFPPYYSREQVKQTIDLFAERVMPEFR
jgi:alkanesulfonate monooxygenase SsuD/methylene tetrahydromethanopterin reductase-like flavin-dependent oxidoreductase (luciferase family)